MVYAPSDEAGRIRDRISGLSRQKGLKQLVGQTVLAHELSAKAKKVDPQNPRSTIIGVIKKIIGLNI